MEFFAGLVLGALLGVVADRLWNRFEGMPRIRALTYTFQRVGNIEGMGYHISNIGTAPIPDYEIKLFHPGRGSLGVFMTEKVGPLLPGQQRDHECGHVEGDRDFWFAHYFNTCEGKNINNIAFEGFEFQLKMKDSNTILFRSDTMGNALAEHLAKVTKGECRLGSWSYIDQKRLDTPWPTKRSKRLFRLMVLLGLRHDVPEDRVVEA